VHSPALQLSDRSEIPVYQQIATQLGAQIERGDLGEGARLPAIRALAGDLGVNRDTVSLAYELLATRGLVESTVGRGTFVRLVGAGRGDAEKVATVLSSQAEQLLHFDAGRPRYRAGADVIALNSLIPDPSLYPVAEFRRCLDKVLNAGGPELFLYGDTQGHPGLRDSVSTRLLDAGISISADEVVLCHGASQGISLAVRLFAGAGESIAVESPTYHNALGTLLSFGVRAAEVPMVEGGPDLDALDRILARPDVKAFYTIPTFHNPMGITTSVAHRRALLEIAARYGKPVIEDAFEMDLRFRGRPVPCLAALDDSDLVVHLSSFSKSLFPGVRTGALAARGRAVDGLVALKHASDLADSLPLHAALDEFLRSGRYDRHLNRLRPILRSRRDAMLDALAAHMPSGTRFTEPDGGYQVWVELPFEIDTRDLVSDAARAGVLFAPGSHFLPDRGPSRCMRLTIARADEVRIRAGVESLGRLAEAARTQPGPVRQTAGVHL
jgi:2-aminoadipate transaminase